jgi:hypothetical protein
MRACSERKYTVKADCREAIDCFSKTICLEISTALPPPVKIQKAICEEEAKEIDAEWAAIVIETNKAAANDVIDEEQLKVLPFIFAWCLDMGVILPFSPTQEEWE